MSYELRVTSYELKLYSTSCILFHELQVTSSFYFTSYFLYYELRVTSYMYFTSYFLHYESRVTSYELHVFCELLFIL